MMNLLIEKNILSKFKDANRIALIGTGGNLAIAQHMASDIYRHTGKFCFAPDSGGMVRNGLALCPCLRGVDQKWGVAEPLHKGGCSEQGCSRAAA